ncbi:hypothetical protein N5U36_10455 [Aliarcobacter butzleri]|nr:hypothetical protein [Aliarcobacter butzleri]MCT7635873.1 hypothetical protein [Aliarcobacter butzleri]
MSVPLKLTEDTFAEVFLEKPPKEYIIKPLKNKTFFGLEIHQDKLIKIDDIKKLPFYDFWLESSKGSTYAIIDNEEYAYLNDFENFSKLFIEIGKNRFEKRD